VDAIKKRIFVIEDDEDILELLRITLSSAGFEVRTSATGSNALAKVKAMQPDLVLLDLMLPGISGFKICESLRSDPTVREIPIIMLTARSAETDRVRGLELGADDYVSKPFSPRELVLRIKAVLRRENSPNAVDTLLNSGSISLDVERHRASVDNRELNLTATEFKLLLELMRKKGRVLDRQQLLSGVWTDFYDGYERTVDTHIRRLRKKLGPAASMIETVRGIGYRLRDRSAS